MLRIRRATPADCRLLWEWANDPVVRAVSFAHDFIHWEDHVQWCSRKLADAKCHLFVVEDKNGGPVGQVRFDISGEGEAVISVTIAQEKRGSGYGARAIELAVEELFRSTQVDLIHSYIKVDNRKSIRVFEKASFSPGGRKTFQGEEVNHYWRQRGGA